MEIAITTVTKNRPFSKALTRIFPKLKFIKSIASDLNSTDESFDILQVVFMDRPESHCIALGTKKNDRLFQVEGGIPEMINYAPSSDSLLFTQIIQQINRAIYASNLSLEKKDITSKRLISELNTEDSTKK